MGSLTASESCSIAELLCPGPASAGAGSAVQARSAPTACLATLLSTERGKAILQQQQHRMQQMQPQEEHAATKAQQQTAQLAALLATDAGKALVQQQLSGLLKRQQQQQQQRTSLPAPHSFANQNNNEAAAAAALEQADESTCSLADVHPGVLSTAVAVSRTAPGSTDRAAGLALLKQELMQHAPLATALALAAPAGSTGAPANPAGADATAASQVQQQADKAPMSPTAGSDEAPLTVAMAWAMLQQQNKQCQQGQLKGLDSALEGAISLGLMRHDTVQSAQSNHCPRQETADAAGFAGLQQQQGGAAAAVAASHAAASARGGAGSQAQQLIFKRRSATSTALRKHFSNASKTVREPAGGSPAGFAKPQQVFKKQRKRPLMLWSSGSGMSQQVPAAKHLQWPALSAPAAEQHATAEHERSTVTGSSGVTGSMLQAFLEARGQTTAGTAAAAGVQPAVLGSQASGVDSVLSTLARQEQQLMMLQQQLQQQRRLFLAQRQAAAAAAAPVVSSAAATANAVKALELELLLGNQVTGVNLSTVPAQAAAMPAESHDVEMADVYQQQPAVLAAEQLHQVQQPLQQHGVQAGAPSVALTALMSLVDALSNKQQSQQQQSQQQHPQQQQPQQQQQQQQQQQSATHTQMGWDTDVMRKLTAALLAS